MATLTIRPTGVGNTTQLTPVGETNNWECVDDVTPDDDTTRVSPTAVLKYDTYQMANHTSETGGISNVRVHIRCMQYASDSGDYARAMVRSGGTDYYGSSETLTLGYDDYYHDWALNPADSEAWEWSDIDALEAGIELSKNDTVSPRCTQVYIVITFDETGTSDRNLSVAIDLGTAKTDVNVSVDVEVFSTSDRSVSVDISANVLELCYYDTINSRWTDGSYGGVRVRVIDKVTKLQKDEGINKLSTLKFDIFNYDENWGIEEGAIIALGKDFAWAGTPGASASEFNTGFLFQGQVTRLTKSSPNPEGKYDLMVEAVHSINTLYNQYVNYLITIIRVYQGGDEKLCTSAYNLKELIGDVTYYNESGTVDDLPAYIKRDNEYINHKEYVDKNKLEVFLDICKNSQNVFYCHNEAFYFEPKKPVMMATYYQKPFWEQNYNAMTYDSTFKHNRGSVLISNTYDLINVAGPWEQRNAVLASIRNTSPYNSRCYGFSFWGGKFKNGADTNFGTFFPMTDGRTLDTGIGGEYWAPVSTTDIELVHNTSAYAGTLDANTQYMLRLTMAQVDTYEIEYGTQFPSRIHYPFAIYVTDDTTSKYIWRSTFTMPVHLFAADQIRWFEPSIPPRFIVYKDGTQLDQWYAEGWNPEVSEYCLSGLVHETGFWDIMPWSTYPHQFLLPRDYNVISDMSGVTAENAGIDEDTVLRNWYNDMEEIEVEFEFIDTIDNQFDTTDDQEFGLCFAFDWDNNGLSDYIMANVISDVSSGTDIEFDRVEDDVTTNVSTHNYTTSHDAYISKIKIGIKFDSGSTWMKVQGYCTNDTAWEGSSWIDMGVGAGEGEGVGIRAVKWIGTGIKYLTMREIYGIESELSNDLVTSKKTKNKGLASQYVVIGEKNVIGGSRVPFGKYPNTPDGSGPILVKKLKVYSDDAAKSAAQYLYEADEGESVTIEVYDLFDTYPNEFLRPNKQIKIDSDYYYIDKMSFDIKQNVCGNCHVIS